MSDVRDVNRMGEYGGILVFVYFVKIIERFLAFFV